MLEQGNAAPDYKALAERLAPIARNDKSAFQLQAKLDAALLYGDGLKDYLIKSSEVTCEGAYSMFTGSSDGFLDIYFQDKNGQYEHVLNYWLGREGLTLTKYKNGYRYYSKYSKSYLVWDKQQSKFLSYYGPEKRLDV